MGKRLRTFSTGLKRARKEKGWTQEKLAEEMDVSLETVRNWEQGSNPQNWKKLLRLCELFQCDMDYLFDRIDFKTHDLQFIHQQTDLSQEAIQTLAAWQQAKAAGKAKLLENEEPLNAPLLQGDVQNAYARSHIVNRLLCDEEFWDELTNAGCRIVHHTILELHAKKGTRLYVSEDGVPLYNPFQARDGIDSARFAASRAFDAFFSRLCRDSGFIETGLIDENSLSAEDEEATHDSLIAFGIKKKLLDE